MRWPILRPKEAEAFALTTRVSRNTLNDCLRQLEREEFVMKVAVKGKTGKTTGYVWKLREESIDRLLSSYLSEALFVRHSDAGVLQNYLLQDRLHDATGLRDLYATPGDSERGAREQAEILADFYDLNLRYLAAYLHLIVNARYDRMDGKEAEEFANRMGDFGYEILGDMARQFYLHRSLMRPGTGDTALKDQPSPVDELKRDGRFPPIPVA